MKPSATDSPSIEEWNTRLHAMPRETVAAYASAEDSRLTARLMKLSEDMQAAMAAWRNLGLTDTVRILFGRLEKYLSGLIDGRRRRTFPQSILQRIRDFFSEEEPHSAFPEDLSQQLDGAFQQATAYDWRMKALEDEHGAAIHAYMIWISALTQTRVAPEAGDENFAVQSIIRRSVEIISAQQHLAHAVALQRQHIQKMATDIRHTVDVAKSLSASRYAAGEFQDARYAAWLKSLQEGF